VLRQNQFGGSFGGAIPASRDIWGPLAGAFKTSSSLETTRAREQPRASLRHDAWDQHPGVAGRSFRRQPEGDLLPERAPARPHFLRSGGARVLELPANKCPLFSDSKFCIPSLPGTPGFNASGNLNRAFLSRSGLGTYFDDQFTIHHGQAAHLEG
jgi:hypothetical protein